MPSCAWRPIVRDTKALVGVFRGITPGLWQAEGMQRASLMRALARFANRRLRGKTAKLALYY